MSKQESVLVIKVNMTELLCVIVGFFSCALILSPIIYMLHRSNKDAYDYIKAVQNPVAYNRQKATQVPTPDKTIQSQKERDLQDYDRLIMSGEASDKDIERFGEREAVIS